ncbi:MAG: lipoate--protein ligase family protein [Candidatus Eiseniibacteriota bacterium]|nr:MAG: lipoate--protein ligase family protein [Candidatus Eisenbacteria bacterium]
METPRLLLCEPADGFRNMAVDEILLDGCKDGTVGAALRIYRWEPPAVSLGYSQGPDLLDVENCKAAGVDVVRRVTGGGALLHWEEITYCFVAREEFLPLPLRPREFAGLAAAAVGRALVRLGVEASVVSRGREARVRGREARVRAGNSPLCFTRGAENEIAVEGRKLAGCAHRVSDRTYFSHGSVMVGPAHLRVLELLRPGVPRADFLAVREGCVSLSELLECVPSFEEAGRVLKEGFEECFGLSFREGKLSSHEERLISERALEKRNIVARRDRSEA